MAGGDSRTCRIDPEVTTTICVTCAGTLGKPDFPRRFQATVNRLNDLLGVQVKVYKLEPWNSVRVTLSVPRGAAQRLLQLTQQDSSRLRALGILDVQLDGGESSTNPTVLKVEDVSREEESTGPSQQIIKTIPETQDGANKIKTTVASNLLLPPNSNNITAGGSSRAINNNSRDVQFKSPNVVCPSDSVVPKVVSGANVVPTGSQPPLISAKKPPHAGPFPFASMNQAIHSNNGVVVTSAKTSSTEPPPFIAPPPQPTAVVGLLPPPYPGVRKNYNVGNTQIQQQHIPLTPPPSPAVANTSPLLVNLLQNNDYQSSAAVAITNCRSSIVPTQFVEPPSAKVTASTTIMLDHQSVGTNGLNSQIKQSPPQLFKEVVTSIDFGVKRIPNQEVILPQSNMLTNINNNNSCNNSSSISPSALITSNTLSSDRSNGNLFVSKTSSTTYIQNGNNNRTQYERTPHGSLIAMNKSYKPQIIEPNSDIPIHQKRLNIPPIVMGRESYVDGQNIVMHSQSIPVQRISTATSVFGITNIVHRSNDISHHPSPQISQQILKVTSGDSTIPMTLPGNSSRNLIDGLLNRQHPHNLSAAHLSESQKLPLATPSTTALAPPRPPPPPPYSVAIARNSWDPLVVTNSTTNLLDLTPSILTDLKPDELDDLLLPTLGHISPLPELSELELLGNETNSPMASQLHSKDEISGGTNSNCDNFNDLRSFESKDGKKFLINPSTGELEPRHIEEDENDLEEIKDVFSGLPSPPFGLLSDEDNIGNFTVPLSDPSAEQTDESKQLSSVIDGKYTKTKNSKFKREVRDMSSATGLMKNEKIKLRLKLEKSEPQINSSAYKVDVSFVNAAKKAAAVALPTSETVAFNNDDCPPLRVPPLHISLRGRNSVVLKTRTKSTDGTRKIKKNQQGKSKKEEKNDAQKEMENNKETKEPLYGNNNATSKYIFSNHPYKDKQAKDRRGSDSELVKINNSNKKVLNADIDDLADSEEVTKRRRRTSQSELTEGQFTAHGDLMPTVPGSTNIGTIGVLPSQKIRKDKVKFKDVGFKMKDPNRRILHSNTQKSPSLLLINNKSINSIYSLEKSQMKSLTPNAVALPTAIDLDMEAKFKQSLLENGGKIGGENVSRLPSHNRDIVCQHVSDATHPNFNIDEKLAAKNCLKQDCTQTPPATVPTLSKKKLPETIATTENDKCYVQEDGETKSIDLLLQDKGGGGGGEKQTTMILNNTRNRSPTNSGSSSGSGQGAGEDSGIESMDALSEKSPNQASQSPHGDIISVALKTRTSTDLLDDIESQLAKMEGLDRNDNCTVKNSKNHLRTNLEQVIAVNADTKSGEGNSDRSILSFDGKEKLNLINATDSSICHNLVRTFQSGNTNANDEKSDTRNTKKDDILQSSNPQQQQQQSSIRSTPKGMYGYDSISNNPENKGTTGMESTPLITEAEEDEDSNLGSTSSTSSLMIPSTEQAQINNNNKSKKSLLEQLLIEIPHDHGTFSSSHSPATRSSIRTRAFTKAGHSPELLHSPTVLASKSIRAGTTLHPATKRKRNDTDNLHVTEETVFKKRTKKNSEAIEVSKKTVQNTNVHAKRASKVSAATGVCNVIQQSQQQDESSDSDEPLMEKLRKNTAVTSLPKTNSKLNKAVNSQTIANQNASGGGLTTGHLQQCSTPIKTNTRRSARAGIQQQQITTLQNTKRNREKMAHAQQQHGAVAPSNNAEAEAALRRKTRSADIESKRKKEVK